MKEMMLDSESIRSCFPKRKDDTHKGDYGKDLLLCGSIGFTGAAEMAARGALRVGAGLVFLGVPQSIYEIEAIKLTEPVVFPLDDLDGKMSDSADEEIRKRLEKMDAVCIGSGMGISAGTERILNTVLERFDGPVVVDADGLSILANHLEWLKKRRKPTILTPHAGEFQRMTGMEASLENAVSFARQYQVIVLMKGHRTVVTDGDIIYRNETGNPGMAVGGSGDVLAGVITGLLGQGVKPFEAASVGVWLHGKAGDRCAQKLGEYGMLPSDMIAELPYVIRDL